MRLDLDPKKAWNDQISPTSPESQGSSRPFRRRRSKARKAVEGDVVKTSEKMVEASANVDEADLARGEENDGDTQGPPKPWPPSYSITIKETTDLKQERQTTKGPPLQPIDTDIAQHPLYGNPRAHFEASAALDRATAALNEQWTARTPTPTAADFKEMLETYISDGPDEIDRLVEMAERMSETKIAVAQREAFEAGKAEALASMAESSRAATPGSGLRSARTPLISARSSHFEASTEMHPTTPRTPALVTGTTDLDAPTPRTPALVTGTADLPATTRSLRLHLHLYPARTLLSAFLFHDAELPALEAAREAARHAYLALGQARAGIAAVAATEEDYDEGGWSVAGMEAMALQGRCAYYVGVAEWVLGEHRRRERVLLKGGRNDGDVGSEDDGVPVLEFFQQARMAQEGGFAEGAWAEKWIRFLCDDKEDGKKRVEDADGMCEAVGRRESTTWLGWLSNIRNPFRQSLTPSQEAPGDELQLGEPLDILSDTEFVDNEHADYELTSPAVSNGVENDIPIPSDTTLTTSSSVPRTPELVGVDDESNPISPTSPLTPPKTPPSRTRRRSHNVEVSPRPKAAGEAVKQLRKVPSADILNVIIDEGEAAV